MTDHHSHATQGNNGPNPIPHLAGPSTTTQSPSTRLAWTLQGDDLVLPAALIPISKEGFSIYLQVWNSLVTIDRQGSPLDNIDLHPVIYAVTRATLDDDGSRWLPFAEAVVGEYKERRTLARNPLRFKTENRLSTIPMIGPLASLGVQDDQDRRRLLRRKDGTIVAVRPRSEE